MHKIRQNNQAASKYVVSSSKSESKRYSVVLRSKGRPYVLPKKSHRKTIIVDTKCVFLYLFIMEVEI